MVKCYVVQLKDIAMRQEKSLKWFDKAVGAVLWALSVSETETAKWVHCS